jgi:hypothetical protein
MFYHVPEEKPEGIFAEVPVIVVCEAFPGEKEIIGRFFFIDPESPSPQQRREGRSEFREGLPESPDLGLQGKVLISNFILAHQNWLSCPFHVYSKKGGRFCQFLQTLSVLFFLT